MLQAAGKGRIGKHLLTSKHTCKRGSLSFYRWTRGANLAGWQPPTSLSRGWSFLSECGCEGKAVRCGVVLAVTPPVSGGLSELSTKGRVEAPKVSIPEQVQENTTLSSHSFNHRSFHILSPIFIIYLFIYLFIYYKLINLFIIFVRVGSSLLRADFL